MSPAALSGPRLQALEGLAGREPVAAAAPPADLLEPRLLTRTLDLVTSVVKGLASRCASGPAPASFPFPARYCRSFFFHLGFCCRGGVSVPVPSFRSHCPVGLRAEVDVASELVGLLTAAIGKRKGLERQVRDRLALVRVELQLAQGDLAGAQVALRALLRSWPSSLRLWNLLSEAADGRNYIRGSSKSLQVRPHPPPSFTRAPRLQLLGGGRFRIPSNVVIVSTLALITPPRHLDPPTQALRENCPEAGVVALVLGHHHLQAQEYPTAIIEYLSALSSLSPQHHQARKAAFAPFLAETRGRPLLPAAGLPPPRCCRRLTCCLPLLRFRSWAGRG